MMSGDGKLAVRHGTFMVLVAGGVILYHRPLMELVALSSKSELYQHIPLIPLISLYFLVVHRREFIPGVRWSPAAGICGLMLALALYAMGGRVEPGLDRNDYLSMMMTGLVIWVLGSFVASYGIHGLKRFLFSMLFLAFLIPVPGFLLDPVVTFLQFASADVSEFVFRLTGVPFLREGMVFSLPGISAEVARECSGIRSSLALVITSIIAGKLSLRTPWSKMGLVAAILPITVFKNALRIVTLSLLGSYVDPVFITGHWLHRSGGIPFFVLGLVLLAPVLWVLRRIERGTAAGQADSRPVRGPAKPAGWMNRLFRNEISRGF